MYPNDRKTDMLACSACSLSLGVFKMPVCFTSIQGREFHIKLVQQKDMVVKYDAQKQKRICENYKTEYA